MAEPMHPKTRSRLLSLLEKDSSLLIFEVMIKTGLRTHELWNMELREGGLFIHACKGSVDHLCPLPDAFIARLQCHWADLVSDMRRYSHASYNRILRFRWDAFRSSHAFLTPYSLHSLRSAYAIQVYQQTKDVILVQQLLGHRAITSTMRYVRMTLIEENRDAILKAIS